MESPLPIVIYTLQLEHDRYYVGKTNKKLEDRFKEHLEGKGAAWTRVYKPILVLESDFDSKTSFAEENKTKEYMIKYGIHKVRGGPYVSLALDDDTVKTIQKQLWHALNLCFRCGGDHYVRDCKNEEQKFCCRCGGQDHWASICTVMFDIEGVALPKGVLRM